MLQLVLLRPFLRVPAMSTMQVRPAVTAMQVLVPAGAVHVLVMLLLAMLVYVASDDERLQPGSPAGEEVPAALADE